MDGRNRGRLVDTRAVDESLHARLEASGYGAPGFAERYDRHRPSPPSVLLGLLPALAGVDRPRLVVDLGCGTGLSTRVWADRADHVVGVEPNAAMVTFARAVAGAESVEYLQASGYETGLADHCADIVTASQALHWMEPERVLPEIGRILRPGGVLCAYEYFTLTTPLWEPEAAFAELRSRTRALREQRGLASAALWPVSRTRLEDSRVFRATRELVVHGVEMGDGERLLGFALSEGSLQTLLDAGATEDEVGLTHLRDAADAMPDELPWWLGYRVWLGLK